MIRLMWFHLFVLLSSCSYLESRNMLAMNEEQPEHWFVPNRDFQAVGGDEEAPDNYDELMSRVPADSEAKQVYLQNRALKKELAELESRQPEELNEMYTRVKHKFANDSERIYFLRLGSFREREEFLVGKGLKVTSTPYRLWEREVAQERLDLVPGMGKRNVMQMFGTPERVEVGGNPLYENERWAYRQASGETRFIYFEGGRVTGWSDK
jgi:hypothetical protein